MGSCLGVMGNGGMTALEGGITKEYRETFGEDERIYCLNWDDGFMGVYICKSFSNFTL